MGNIGDNVSKDVNPADYEPTGSFDVLPPGEYLTLIEKAEIRPTRDKTGTMLKIQFAVNGPKYNNRKIFNNYNIGNRSQKAAGIAVSQLKALGMAINMPGILESDTSDLIDKAVVLKLGVKSDEKYGSENTIRGYKPVPGGVQSNASPESQKETPTTGSNNSKPPWE